jgi:hypothetical protein
VEVTNKRGKFDVVELLGSGPNGDASLAVDTVLGRVVVLKSYDKTVTVANEAALSAGILGAGAREWGQH